MPDDEGPEDKANEPTYSPQPGWQNRCDRCGCWLCGPPICKRHPKRCRRCDRCGSGWGHDYWHDCYGQRDCDDKENLEAIGSLPAMQYWNDLVSVSLGAWQDAIMRGIGIWQRTVLCRYHGHAEFACDVAELWSEWGKGTLTFAEFPFEWHMRRHLSVPSLVFIVDEAAETTMPQSAPAPINAEGLPVYATDLQMISGPSTVNPDHVQVELLQHGNRVEVTLVNLGTAELQLGRYVGVAYAYEHPHRLPLALVYLFVVPSGVIQPFPMPVT